MNRKYRIPKKLLEDYKDDICFMVDCDKVYMQEVKPRVVWVKPLIYEVNIDDTKDIIEALLNEPIDPKAPYFGTCEEAKARIELEIKLPQVVNKGKKRIAKLRQASSTLLLTKGKGDDVEEDEVEEAKFEEEEPIRNTCKVIITQPTKSSTILFTRRESRLRTNLNYVRRIPRKLFSRNLHLNLRKN